MRTFLYIPLVLLLLLNSYGQDKQSDRTVDELISTHIATAAKVEFDKRMAFMQIVIDDIARLCELKQEQKQDLILAAKGAATRSMDQWNEQAVHHFQTCLLYTSPSPRD